MQVTFDPILNTLRKKDEGGGSGEFDPKGVYPELTVGGLIGKASDAIKDLNKTYIFRTTAGDNSISDGYARILGYNGNVINGIPFLATKFRAVGFNAIPQDQILQNKTIDAQGNIIDNPGTSVAYFHAVACSEGAGNENGYIIRHKDGVEAEVIKVGWAATADSQSVSILEAGTHGISNSYLPEEEGYIFVATDNTADLCAHLAWSGYRDAQTEDFAYTETTMPMCHAWGMAMAGLVYDEVQCKEIGDKFHIIKTTRTDRALLSALEWQEIETRHEPEVGEPYTTYSYKSSNLINLIKHGTTNLTCHNLSSACVIRVDEDGNVFVDCGTTQFIPGTDFQAYLYYELAEYVTDEFEGDMQLYVWDFGTEEIIGNGIAPRTISTEYMVNYTDFVRNLYMNQAEEYDVEKIIFEGASSTIYACDKNLQVKEIICFACNTPLLDGAPLAQGSTITRTTIHNLSVTMTDTNAILLIKTQKIG